MAGAISTIIVALIGLIGIIYQSRSSKKIDDNKTVLEQVGKQIEELRQEMKENDANINKRVDDISLNMIKRFLVYRLSDLQNGKDGPLTEEQERILHETKEVYNELGGDSYVDTMFERLEKKDIL